LRWRSKHRTTSTVTGSFIRRTNAENGEVVVKHVQIAQFGTRITGHFDGPNQSGTIDGVVNGRRIRFSTATREVLHFGREIFGDTMNGSYGIRGKHASWEAIRTTASPQDYPTGTVLSAMPMLVTNQPPPPVPDPQYSEPAPAPATPTSSQTTYQSAPQSDSQSTADTTDNASQTQSSPTPAPQTADQLDALVAPIALYPDALVAQVLAAASYPEQISFADYWLSQNKTLTGTSLAQAVDQEPWDPSVKGLTQFPTVLHTLASNLTWTSNLGDAFQNQQPDVMAAVQRMRAKAQAAGNLQSTPQIQVVQQSPSTIVIQPTNPQVVYVPQYNPAVVYGVPYVVPAYTPPVAIAAVGGISFDAGVAIGPVFGGGGGGFVAGGGFGFGWGWGAWGCNWGGGGGTVIYNHNTYINNTYVHNWHGANYNNYHPWGPGNHGYGPDGPHHYGPNGGEPNGGHNGDHGLIGGNGGVEHGPNGGRNGDHGLIGGNGGVNHGPNGGRNANGGLIGGNGGVRNADTDRTQHLNTSASRSRMSGDGRAARSESNRGRASMNRSRAVHASHPHMSAPHRSGGGGGGRRR
jgi:Protein of unknown function (DUF3300)